MAVVVFIVCCIVRLHCGGELLTTQPIFGGKILFGAEKSFRASSFHKIMMMRIYANARIAAAAGWLAGCSELAVGSVPSRTIKPS